MIFPIQYETDVLAESPGYGAGKGGFVKDSGDGIFALVWKVRRSLHRPLDHIRFLRNHGICTCCSPSQSPSTFRLLWLRPKAAFCLLRTLCSAMFQLEPRSQTNSRVPSLRQDLRVSVKKGGKVLLHDISGVITSGFYAVMVRSNFLFSNRPSRALSAWR